MKASFIVGWILAVLLTVPSSVLGAKPPRIPAYHDGSIVHFTVVNDNVEGVDRGNLDEVAIPLYAFGPSGDQPQFDVLGAVPGDPDYNPWWKLMAVLTDRDVSVDPFTSDAEILAAAAAGEVLLIPMDFVFLCQVLPGNTDHRRCSDELHRSFER